MVLGFKPRFKEPILAGTKKFSIRRGQRWRAGMTIHMATGTRTKNYDQFNKGMPHLSKCIRTQNINLHFEFKGGVKKLVVFVDGKFLDYNLLATLAKLDGFKDLADFKAYWEEEEPLEGGQIIHWTDFYF